MTYQLVLGNGQCETLQGFTFGLMQSHVQEINATEGTSTIVAVTDTAGQLIWVPRERGQWIDEPWTREHINHKW